MKKKLIFGLGAILTVAGVQSASAAVIVSDDFNYADLSALQANWGSTAGLSLNSSDGKPAPSASHDGSASIHQWVGSTFSITPTDAAPLLLSADLWYSGNNNQRNTLGLRTGASPLFEIGFYNQAVNNGLGVRVLNFAGNNDWTNSFTFVELGNGASAAQWIHVEALFTSKSVTVSYDLGADGTVDKTFTSTGANDVGAFTDLRFGGPSGVSSANGGFSVDNINLETVAAVPEPSTLALGLLGGAGLVAGYIRRRSK